MFPTIEVRAPLHDLRSSETVHMVTPFALRTLPVDQLADVVRTLPGVVADGEELHVRGGRAGELDQVLDGVTLNEPLGGRTMNLPLLALRSVELVSGGQDAEFNGALAGVMQLRTVDPGERWSAAWRYTSDGGLDTHYDQGSARVSGPLSVLGLGAVAAADVSGDDTWLPTDRTNRHHGLAGLRIGWRAENRLLGYLKLVPLSSPQSASLQILASRELHEPYDPAWTKDGWYSPYACDTCALPAWSDTAFSGSTHYHAPDHLAITDERRVATIFTLARASGPTRTTLDVGWTHASSVRSPSGQPGDGYLLAEGPPVLGIEGKWQDPFYVYFGDDPFYRETRADQLSIRADRTWARNQDQTTRAGAGLTYDDVSLLELDATTFGKRLDSLRTFHAYAPGGYAYAQTRWRYQGMLVSVGARAQAFTAGPQASRQAQPTDARVRFSLSPRLGIAYPISDRDVFSLAYVRLEQDPARQFLYENRRVIVNRQPLGNAALVPATVISYQGAIKRVLDPEWAAQVGIFYRDVYGQVGSRNLSAFPGVTELQYTNEDEAHALGAELSLVHEAERRHAELRYTWMQAYGSESRPEGDPYGLVRGPRVPPIGDQALSWDRRHSVSFSGFWPLWERWTLSWATAVGSGLPWTPRARRQLVDNPATINTARFDWSENTDLNLRWDPPILPVPFSVGLDVRNVFDNRGERAATVDGYPHPLINTVYDDYGAYRTETGRGGGAYWYDADGNGNPGWVPVHDPRLLNPPRRLRVSLGANW